MPDSEKVTYCPMNHFQRGLWGMWKNGSAYRPEWVAVAAAANPATKVSR